MNNKAKKEGMRRIALGILLLSVFIAGTTVGAMVQYYFPTSTLWLW